ncbi:MAG: glycosyltransferase family 1 protein, partial [Opitutales bacterium]
MPITLDLSHTAHCPAQTGIQRVCRELFAQLSATGHAPVPLIFDRYACRWRSPDATELSHLSPAAAKSPGRRRGEVWTVAQKLRGRLGRVKEPRWPSLRHTPLLAPEIFNHKTFAAYRDLRAHLHGPTAAIFYDAVVLRFPELSPPASVNRFPAYLRELATFDGIAAISHASRDELLDHWKRLGLRDHPPVESIPLGLDVPTRSLSPIPQNSHPPL